MIGVIGCGNMASAIVKGIHQRFGQEEFLTYTPSFTRADSLARSVQGKAVKNLSELQNCQALIIGCKPQQFDELAVNLTKSISLHNKYIISIMAAIPVETIVQKLNVKEVTRIMPNTPSFYGEGVSLMLHTDDATPEWREKCHDYFSACSKVHLIKDELSFDQVTTVTGSGPAYVYLFALGFMEQLQKWGIEEADARSMVNQLFKGSSILMEENSHRPLKELIAEVTSKGGVTIEAVKVYENKELNEVTRLALDAAFKRSKELTENLK